MSGPILSEEKCRALFETPKVDSMRHEPALAGFITYVFSRAGYRVEPVPGVHGFCKLYPSQTADGSLAGWLLLHIPEMMRVGPADLRWVAEHTEGILPRYIVSRTGFNTEAMALAPEFPQLRLLDLSALQRYIRYIQGTYYNQLGSAPVPPDHVLFTVNHRLTSQTKVLALANNKGGVGKTTTALNLAFGLAARGKRVLLVDMDPQANATQALLKDAAAPSPHLADYFARRAKFHEVVYSTEFKNVWVAPSHTDLRLIHPDLSALPEVEVKFANDLHNQAVRPVPEDGSHFDWVVIDTPPAIGVHTRAALAASHYVVAPAAPSVFAGSGLNQLFEAIDAMSAMSGGASVLGCVITQWQDAQVRVDAQTRIETMLQGSGIKRFKAIIPFDQNIERAHQETMSRGVTLFGLARRPGPGARGYNDLLQEVLEYVDNA